MSKNRNVLAIETSCDETAIALVSEDGAVLFHELHSQISIHEQYGGVVPEVAARNHVEVLPTLIEASLKNGNLCLNDVDAIAVTSGPGLIGGVMVGVMVAKSLAAVLEKPIIPVNHLAGHALTARLTDNVEFPYILLLLSGGHSQIMVVRSAMDYQLLGSTKDDSLGETFDKVAKMMGLGYPGGPVIEKLAKQGNARAFDFPKPLYKQKTCDLSFSGLKTAVSRSVSALIDKDELNHGAKADIAASFQCAVSQVLSDKLECAMDICSELYSDGNCDNVVVAGGVAANRYIAGVLSGVAEECGLTFVTPPIKLCTDNAIMIAWAAIEIMKDKRYRESCYYDLSFMPRSRWPLDEMNHYISTGTE